MDGMQTISNASPARDDASAAGPLDVFGVRQGLELWSQGLARGAALTCALQAGQADFAERAFLLNFNAVRDQGAVADRGPLSDRVVWAGAAMQLCLDHMDRSAATLRRAFAAGPEAP